MSKCNEIKKIEVIEKKEPIFIPEKMALLIQVDVIFRFMYNVLNKKNTIISKERLLEKFFNSMVLGDLVMTDKYNSL